LCLYVDSLIYHIQTEDVFEDMKANGEHFDMSEYDPKHPIFGKFHDPKNKKVLGVFKDETANSIITHVAAPRPKMYSLRRLAVDQDKETKQYLRNSDDSLKIKVIETKKAKGISKAAVKNRIPLEDFSNVLEHNIQTHVTMRGIRSFEHKIHTETVRKKALNGLDSKRFGMDFVNSLAFGHCDIPLYE
jgi:hypothetical protein